MATLANGVIKPSKRKACERSIKAAISDVSALVDRDKDIRQQLKLFDDYVREWKEMII